MYRLNLEGILFFRSKLILYNKERTRLAICLKYAFCYRRNAHHVDVIRYLQVQTQTPLKGKTENHTTHKQGGIQMKNETEVSLLLVNLLYKISKFLLGNLFDSPFIRFFVFTTG